MAVTYTGAQTFTRFSLLELQVRTMLREAAEISPSALDKSQGLRDPHYIEIIAVQVLYPSGTIGAEMRLYIDWRQYAIELQSGGSEVQVPASWEGGIAPSIQEGVRTLLLACDGAHLGREWCVVYQSHFDADAVNRILGFTRRPHYRWERDPESSGDLPLGPLW